MTNLVAQPTSKPIRKVSAGAALAALGTVALWVASSLGIEVPGEVGSAVATLAFFAGAYFTKERG